MPTIKSSTDLRNNYNEISRLCHERKEPIFITKNGRGDLAVMSMEAYDRISGTRDLVELFNEGWEDIKAGRVVSMEEAREAVYAEIAKWENPPCEN
jgi:prevent-host-death family protein